MTVHIIKNPHLLRPLIGLELKKNTSMAKNLNFKASDWIESQKKHLGLLSFHHSLGGQMMIFFYSDSLLIISGLVRASLSRI